jgi:hypothetical protein
VDKAIFALTINSLGRIESPGLRRCSGLFQHQQLDRAAAICGQQVACSKLVPKVAA